MSVTIDANILIEAANADSERHQRAREVLAALVGGSEPLFVFWPVALAFIRVATHPRLFPAPLDVPTALQGLDLLLGRDNVRTGAEARGFLAQLRDIALPAAARGKLIHDAHLVALMRQHGVGTIWTNDLDFRRFRNITVIDPFA